MMAWNSVLIKLIYVYNSHDDFIFVFFSDAASKQIDELGKGTFTGVTIGESFHLENHRLEVYNMNITYMKKEEKGSPLEMEWITYYAKSRKRKIRTQVTL
ncbi:hypothetical protein ATL39_3056 [Sinobaca qinghaiensis]|uniref:Uncharacterized protein n=1 Tax=Sinobaca qinghaiensis TaxID=342944 RepID=A0A419UWW1_9BACL|nr:hypothetical protein [Sinobaca qinghaiensis]RKD69632.1 hypothetical protein ATL39_3056 [Sinobaca qinghaiensis]